MKLYQWDSSEQRFTTGDTFDPISATSQVLLMGLEVSKGEQINGEPAASEQMICLLRGAWRVKIADSQLIVRRNEAVIIPPGFEHSAEAIQDSFALQVVPA